MTSRQPFAGAPRCDGGSVEGAGFPVDIAVSGTEHEVLARAATL